MELIRQGARLRVLNEVAIRGSFSVGADALSMSQSAVSQHIAALETALGVQLVERATRPAQLTEAGSALARHVRSVIARLDNAEQEIAEIAHRRHGRLRFGSFPTALATFVPRVLARFQQREPDVSLTVIDDHLQRLLPRLHDGQLDLAVVYDHDAVPIPAAEDLDLVHLLNDAYRVVLPSGHRLSRSGRSIALTDLRGENWIGGGPSSTWFRIVRHSCNELGFDPRVALISDDYRAVQAFAAADLGVAVVPGLAATAALRGVEVRKIRNVVPTRRIWAARARDSFPTPATVAMIEMLQAATRDDAAGGRR